MTLKVSKIFYNGKIMTLDPRNPQAEAMALQDDKILAVGNNKEIKALATLDSNLHDLAGKVVIPGFNDSHMHLINLGQGMDGVNLTGISSVQELICLGQEFVKENPTRTWILGRGFNEEEFDLKKLPTKNDLDQISQDKPVFFTRICGHICIANSKALKLAGFAKGTPDPPGGSYDKDLLTGEPTGVLRETAIDLVRAQIPSPSVEDLKRVILEASKLAASKGITTAQSNDLKGTRTLINRLEAYRQLAEANELPIRVELQAAMSTPEELKTYLEVRAKHPKLGSMVTLGPLKIFADGSLGGRTAALTYPYADDSNTSGIAIHSQKELDELILIAAQGNLQIAAHAIGDRAMDMVMNSYEQAKQATPDWDVRPRMIHAQITRTDQLERMLKLGFVCDIQPIFVRTDSVFAEARVGKENIKDSYAWKTMQELGIPTAGGSDSPVESCNPLWGMHTAITRQDHFKNPPGGWLPEEKLTALEALTLFTQGSAYANHEEDLKGSLSPRKFGDFIILPEDPTQVEPEKLLTMEILATYVGGQKVFSK